MGILLRISLRNLFRQKRRNFFLGAAIAIGMAILGVANAFSHGISDVLFNRLLTYMSGQVSVVFSQNGNMTRPVFSDGQRMLGLIEKSIPNKFSAEEAIGVLARVIGNARTDNMILVGLNLTSAKRSKALANMRSDFRMVEGQYEDLLRTDLENPVILSSIKAKNLNVRVNDILRIRFQDIHGQNQAARLTVVGIFNPANIFMAAPAFFKMEDIKRIAGYGIHDISGLHITITDPKKNAVPTADSLHKYLHPPLALAQGSLSTVTSAIRSAKVEYSRTVSVNVVGYHVDSTSLKALVKLVSHFAPNRDTLSREDVLISHVLAESLKVGIGDKVEFKYAPQFPDANDPSTLSTGSSTSSSSPSTSSPATVTVAFTLSGILPDSSLLGKNVLLVNDKDFYGFYYENWPKTLGETVPGVRSTALVMDSTSALFPYLSKEWVLLDRTRSTSELRKKYVDIARLKTKATTVDVQTMYESASMIINLEYALNLITLSAVLILFFIIQVGVVNTLRMTIRERTREIGTMRSIGMQKGDVQNIFLLETFFLTFFSCLVGILLSFIAMGLLKLISFSDTGNQLAMLLVDRHLHFVPSFFGILFYFVLILAIAAATAWFPSRRAANLAPSEALSHFG